MTDIEQKALVMVNEVTFERGGRPYISLARMGDAKVEALCRAIEQHEAFRQEVSDIVYAHVHVTRTDDWEKLKTLIIPKPKPDPLVEVVKGVTWYDNEITAKEIRAALDALGFEIREKNDD